LQQAGAASDRFVDDREAAAILGLSRTYLRQLRVKGGGCRFSRFGRAIRYRLSDIYAWAEEKTALSTSQRF
jgi:excisionase family DNA binding protein